MYQPDWSISQRYLRLGLESTRPSSYISPSEESVVISTHDSKLAQGFDEQALMSIEQSTPW